MNTKYSVLMSVYINEQPLFFRLAMDSILAQTVPADEIVIVEDGPLTDELYTLIDYYKQQYPSLITSVINKHNLGLGISLQKGVLVARNEIIARMDTDDIAVPDRCEKQLVFLEDNIDISIVGGQIEEFINTPDNIIGKRVVPESTDEVIKYAKKRCPLNHMTVMFRRKDILDVGNYKDWKWNEDYYLWIRMLLADKKIANLSSTLVMVRSGNDLYKRRGGIKYYLSEKKLQWYMFSNHYISFSRYIVNLVERFVVQILLTNKMRSLVYKIFARR